MLEAVSDIEGTEAEPTEDASAGHVAPSKPRIRGGSKASKPRPRKGYTQELFTALLEAYRRNPGNHTDAARRTGFTWEGCKNAWEKGWSRANPRQPGVRTPLDWAPPIKGIVEAEVRVAKEEREAVRRRAEERIRRTRDLENAKAEEVAKLVEEAIREEAQLQQAVRKGILGGAFVATRLLPAMNALAKVVEDAVLEKGPDGRTLVPKASPGIPPVNALRMIEAYVRAAGRLAAAEEIVLGIGKGARGTTNGAPKDEMGDEELIEELEQATDLRAKILARRDAIEDAGEDDDEEIEH
jgi:hypothetical protein